MIPSSRRHIQRKAKDATFAARLLATATASASKSLPKLIRQTPSTSPSKSSVTTTPNNAKMPSPEDGNVNHPKATKVDTVTDRNRNGKKWPCPECTLLNYDRCWKCRACGAARSLSQTQRRSSSPPPLPPQPTPQPQQSPSISPSSPLPKRKSLVVESDSNCVSSTHNSSVTISAKISLDENESRIDSLMKENKNLKIRIKELERTVEKLSKPQCPSRSNHISDDCATLDKVHKSRKRRRFGIGGRGVPVVGEELCEGISLSKRSDSLVLDSISPPAESPLTVVMLPKPGRSRRRTGTNVPSSNKGIGSFQEFDECNDRSGDMEPYWLHQGLEGQVHRKSYGKNVHKCDLSL